MKPWKSIAGVLWCGSGHVHPVWRAIRPTAGLLAAASAVVLGCGWAGAAWQWQPSGASGGPGARQYAVVVWSGRELLVWGGLPFGIDQDWLNDGWRYDPAADTWQPMQTIAAPAARAFPVGVWTGTSLMIWGGHATTANPASLRTGACYDPIADRWQPVSLSGAPTARGDHTMVWTGSEVIVWGGYNFGSGRTWATGGRYNPSTDTWLSVTTTNRPTKRSKHTAVWTGTRMIVWGGGYLGSNIKIRQPGDYGLYDPAADSWSLWPTTPALEPRSDHTAVWTGTRMIVWGGWNGEWFEQHRLRTGASYDPTTHQWEPLSVEGAPDGRASHTAVWSGREMLIWGGSVTGPAASGGRYDPATGGWSAMPTTDSPAGGYRLAAAWTGEAMGVIHDRFVRCHETGPYALDGIPDDWQYAHFGPQQADGAAGQDPDADGQDNLMEFLAKTDPLDAGSRLVLQLAGITGAGDLEFELHPVWPDRHYVLEQSSLALADDWLPASGEWMDLGNQRTVVVLAQPPDRRRFYRLRVGLK